jgi:glutaredoxin 2
MNNEVSIQEVKRLIGLNKEKILIHNYQKKLLERFVGKKAEESYLEILIEEKEKNSREIKDLFKKTEELMEKLKKMN